MSLCATAGHSLNTCQVSGCHDKGQCVARADGGHQWACSSHVEIVARRYTAEIARWVGR